MNSEEGNNYNVRTDFRRQWEGVFIFFKASLEGSILVFLNSNSGVVQKIRVNQLMDEMISFLCRFSLFLMDIKKVVLSTSIQFTDFMFEAFFRLIQDLFNTIFVVLSYILVLGLDLDFFWFIFERFIFLRLFLEFFLFKESKDKRLGLILKQRK